jgi:hypothetical protein
MSLFRATAGGAKQPAGNFCFQTVLPVLSRALRMPFLVTTMAVWLKTAGEPALSPARATFQTGVWASSAGSAKEKQNITAKYILLVFMLFHTKKEAGVRYSRLSIKLWNYKLNV